MSWHDILSKIVNQSIAILLVIPPTLILAIIIVLIGKRAKRFIEEFYK